MSVARQYPDATFTPSPGAAPRRSRIVTQARADVLGTLRNGEQLLLTLLIPLVLLVVLSLFDLGGSSDGRSGVDVVTPGILALAVMSTAFTSLAIATGFDRRSGALKLLGTTPLRRSDLVIARSLAVLVVEVLQVVLIVAVALALGWSPLGGATGAAATLMLLVLGTTAFATWGVVLAGTLRAEATLAVANGIYLLLLLGGGVVVPLSSLPGPWAAVAALLPSGALAGGLRQVLLEGAGLPVAALVVLAVWTVVGAAVAGRTFRWE